MSVYVTDINNVILKENTVYTINHACDMKGKTLILPDNCTLVFKGRGSISNGVVKGNESKINYNVPFVGENVSFIGCFVVGKSIIRDSEVFLQVKHSQKEIQTLFDISGGKRIEFSRGIYKDVEKIHINSNIDAHFNGGEIQLKWGSNYLAECFYMDPWIDKGVEYVRIKDLKIKGKRNGIANVTVARRCIQFFYVSEVVLDNVIIDEYYSGPYEYKSDASDLLDKSRIGTCTIAIMKYDKCTINRCTTREIYNEIFWCVPNNTPDNITYFTNNVSTSTARTGSASFFTLLDGRCVVKNNRVYNYNGSAFNVYCYDSEISNNIFYNGRRSAAIDLSEGTMYMAQNVSIHNNECINSKGLVAAFGRNITIENNKWVNNNTQDANGCTIISISSRGARSYNGRYVGCDNNPEKETGTKGIIIKKNRIQCNNEDNKVEVKGAYLRGEDIEFVNNKMSGLNVPVVHFVDGSDFIYNNNRILQSQSGDNCELIINNCNNVDIINNTFSRNNIANGYNCSVSILKARGRLCYKQNRVNVIPDVFVQERVYTPCYINDYTELKSAEIVVRSSELKRNTALGIDANNISIKTNIVSK